MPYRRNSRVAGLTLGIVVPAFIYALVITRGSLDPFGWEYGWAAYNQYALALADGRFDVPLEAIGAEGFIVDGRVYMYYGLLPAVARWPLLPFLDLNQVPVSLLMTWAFSTIAAAMLQLALLRIFRASAQRTSDRILLLAASIAVWFGSGPWLALQSGNFYHEPFAAALMLCAIAIYMLVGDFLLGTGTPSARRLCAYALIAGLAVFARQTVALSLYVVVIALCAASLVRGGYAPARLLANMRRTVLPSLILLGFGLSYLWTVAAKFGGDSFPMESYGYYILFSSSPEYAKELSRLATIDAVGQFHWSRLLPNLIYYTIGGYHIRHNLILAMGGGITEAFGPPIRLALVWATPFLLAAAGAWALAAKPRRPTLVALVAALSLGAVAQLCYATVTYRYATELWPPLALLMLIGFAEWMRRPQPNARRSALIALGLLAVSTTMLGYNLSRSAAMRHDAPVKDGAVTRPMPGVLARLVRTPDRDSR